MNSTYVVAVIGAAAGLVTGLGSALIALRTARSQNASERELQRRQWRADTLRDCYSQVAGTHRRLMMAWVDWWDELTADHKREQHIELMQAATSFVTACTAVRVYAPKTVVDRLIELKDLTFEFDTYAEENRNRNDWAEDQESKYERLCLKAEGAMPPFIEAARASIDEVLGGDVS
jgi:hypothetical protein